MVSSIDQTERLAKRFLRDGHPFTMLNLTPIDKKDAKNDISNMLIVRNVIAHQSSFSKKRFQDEVISKALGLLPKEKSPAGAFAKSISRIPRPNPI